MQSRGSPSAEACVTRQRDTDPKTLVHLLVLVLYLGCDAETATVGQIWSGLDCLNRDPGSISGTSASVKLPREVAAG